LPAALIRRSCQCAAPEHDALLVLLQERVLPVSAEDMMTVFDLIDDSAQFAAQLLSEPHAEKEFRDPVLAVRRQRRGLRSVCSQSEKEGSHLRGS
jgi:hypothetical protein